MTKFAIINFENKEKVKNYFVRKMKNKLYKSYEIYIKFPLYFRYEIKVASFDYYFNAIQRRNQLIETFGKYNVIIKRKYIPKEI